MVNSFWKDDDGAVTVDWVVLTAAIVGLGMATMGLVSAGVSDLSGDVGTELANRELGVAGATGSGGESGGGGVPMFCNSGVCYSDTDGNGEYETGWNEGDPDNTSDYTGFGITPPPHL